MKQGYNARLDDSLGAKHGKKSQSMKARRDESEGMEKSMGRRAYSSVGTMDKKAKGGSVSGIGGFKPMEGDSIYRMQKGWG